ncbi:hypothetical protein ACWEQL_29705 [Kitasatospora sp. NPDC004240]
MLPKTVRGLVEVAAELVEEAGKRVVGTAAELLERGGIDLTEVERRLGGPFPPSAKQLQTLAEEAVTAGRAGVDLAVGVARSEVEKAFEKVGDQVTKVGVVLSYLESKLREEAEHQPAAAGAGPAPRAEGLFGDGWEREDRAPGAGTTVAERVVVDGPPAEPADALIVEPEPEPEPEPVAAGGPVAAAGSVAEAPEPKAPARKAAERKASARKAAAKKAAPAEESGAEPTGTEAATGKTAAKKTPARKAPAKKTAVKKTATAKRTAARKTAAEQEAPAKRTATKRTTVRRATTTKKPDA